MNNVEKIKISAYTKDGYESQLKEYRKNIKRMVVLDGYLGCNYSQIFRSVGNYFKRKNVGIVYFEHPLNEDEVEGLYVKEYELLIVEERLLNNEKLNCERINIPTPNFINKSTETGINRLVSEIEDRLAYVKKHLDEANVYLLERESLVRSYVNESKKNDVVDEIQKKLSIFSSKNDTGGTRNTAYINGLQTISPIVINSTTFKQITINSDFNLLSDIMQSEKFQKNDLLQYVSPISTTITPMVYLPVHSLTIINNTFPHYYKTMDKTSVQPIKLPNLMNSHFQSQTVQSKVFDLEMNCSIKMTLASNYLKEAKMKYEQLRNGLTGIEGVEQLSKISNALLHKFVE